MLSEENPEALRMLVEAGADANIQDNKGVAPLHIAAINRHTGNVRVLIAAGADVNSQTRGGDTPLDIAERRRYSV